MRHRMALDHQPAAAAQGVLPKLAVNSTRIGSGVNGVDPGVVVFHAKIGVRLRGVTEVAELFMVTSAAVGAGDA